MIKAVSVSQTRAPWIPVEDQVRLGHEARRYYTDPRHGLGNLKGVKVG